MANLATGEVAVQDLSTGKIWYTNPPAAGEDGVAAGTNKALLKSQISITYTTAEESGYDGDQLYEFGFEKGG